MCNKSKTDRKLTSAHVCGTSLHGSRAKEHGVLCHFPLSFSLVLPFASVLSIPSTNAPHDRKAQLLDHARALRGGLNALPGGRGEGGGGKTAAGVLCKPFADSSGFSDYKFIQR